MRFPILILLIQTAWGQLLPELDPRMPEAMDVESVAAVEAQNGLIGEGAVLIERLKKVRLVTWAGTSTLQATEHLDISEGMILPNAQDLSGKLSRWIGHAVREGDLAAMADTILVHYDQAGYPVVLVEAPEQDPNGGELTFIVELGVIGDIGVTSPAYSDPDSIRKGLWLRRGDVIKRDELDAQMAWYGRNNFRRPRLLVSPGMVPPSADILIGLTERKPWSVSMGFENSGQEAIGRERFILGAVAMTKQEHVIAWQTVLGYPTSSLQAHAAMWEIPFHGIHQTLQLSGSIAQVETETVAAGLPVQDQGTSWGISAIQGIPLPALGRWQQNMQAGIEMKSTDQFVLFGGTGLSPGEVRFVNLRMGYSLERKWKNGGFSVNTSFIGSPGGLASENDDTDFKNYDPDADASYVVGRMSSEGWWTPGGDWRIGLRAEGQLADSRLLPAEQFSAGGYRSVRGVEEREFFADIGWQSSFEIYSPAISLGSDSGIRVLVFYDQAWLRNTGDSSNTISGGGMGIRAKLSEHLDLRLDHGWRLDEKGAMTHLGLRTEF
jgi:hemolysin activation/secretion protein